MDAIYNAFAQDKSLDFDGIDELLTIEMPSQFIMPQDKIVFQGTCHETVMEPIDNFINEFNNGQVPNMAFPKGTGKDTDKDGSESMLYIRFMAWVMFYLGCGGDAMKHACLLGDRHCLGAIKEACDAAAKCGGVPIVKKKCKLIKGDMCCNQHPMAIKLEEKFEMFYAYPFNVRYQNIKHSM